MTDSKIGSETDRKTLIENITSILIPLKTEDESQELNLASLDAFDSEKLQNIQDGLVAIKEQLASYSVKEKQQLMDFIIGSHKPSFVGYCLEKLFAYGLPLEVCVVLPNITRDPEKTYKAIEAIESTGMLDQQNTTVLRNFHILIDLLSSSMLDGVVKLAELGGLNPDTFQRMIDGVFKRQAQVEIAKAFNTLYSAGLFISDYPNIVMRSKKPMELAKAFVHLAEQHIFTEENIEVLLKSEAPEDMATALVEFQETGIDEDFKSLLWELGKDADAYIEAMHDMHEAHIFDKFKTIIFENDHPARFADQLLTLHEMGLLAYFESLDFTKQTSSVVSCLITLRNESLLSEINSETLTHILEHTKPSAVAEALVYVRNHIPLDQNCINLVSHHSVRKPKLMARILSQLDTQGLLNAENMALIQNCIEMENSIILQELLSGIKFLQDSHLLTQENFTRLCSAPYRDALQDECWSLLHRYLRRIPDEFQMTPVQNEGLLTTLFEAIEAENWEILDEEQFDEIVDYIRAQQAAVGVAQPLFNPGQSTHTESVHKSVSTTAIKLGERYPIPNLSAILAEIEVFIRGLSDDDIKQQAAKRCFERFITPGFSVSDDPDTGAQVLYTDPVSGFTILQLLALTFIAIHDDEVRAGTLEDAEKLFVDGLYEIQRGYNIGVGGVDDGKADRIICIPGTFNKLIEKLAGVHPDAQIHYVTKATIGLKFSSVFQERTLEYLNEIANPSTTEDYAAARMIMDRIVAEGGDRESLISKIEGSLRTDIRNEFSEFMQESQLEVLIENLMNNLAPYQEPLPPETLDSLEEKLSRSLGKRLHDEAAAEATPAAGAGTASGVAQMGMFGRDRSSLADPENKPSEPKPG